MSDAGLSGIRDLAPTGMKNVSTAIHGNDRGLIAEFYTEAKEQTFESEQKGRKIYKSVDMIHIFAPGNKSDIRRPVQLEPSDRAPSDIERFPRQWEAFKNQKEQVQEGMPLEMWAKLDKAQVLEWKAAKVHTVEQLSAIPDSAFHNMPFEARKFRDAAKTFLATANDSQAVTSKLAAQTEVQAMEIADLKRQIGELAAMKDKRTKPRNPGDEHDD